VTAMMHVGATPVPGQLRPNRGERGGASRRLGIAVSGLVYAVFSRLSRLTLRHLPEVDGLPVLLGSGASPVDRGHLEAALQVLREYAPSRLARLHRHVLAIFVARQPGVHGHYSRMTGTCTLDATRLESDDPRVTAAAMARAATEAWLWRAGRGRDVEDENRLLDLSDLDRLLLLRRVSAPTRS
jgi:hypothetical protein